jgi:citrate synthase
MKSKSAWVDADEAATLLGVSHATLYAYVSRGRIRSESAPGHTRQRRYARDDIERLLARARERRNPEKAAERVLHWGLPILESAITLIADGRVYYRGHDAAELARTASLAEVAALVWTGSASVERLGTPGKFARKSTLPASAPFVHRAEAALAAAAAADTASHDLRPHAAAQTGWRILHLLTAVATGSAAPAETIDGTIAAAWDAARHTSLIRAALIVCADHELNVSAFTARCVASAGSSPYAVVIAGLAALEGAKHGGSTARIEAFWDSLRGGGDLDAAIGERLRRGEPIDGFGHPLYPGRDPRAALLLEMLPRGKQATFAHEVAAAVESVVGEAPNLDFALVALSRSLGLPDGAPLTLFALGRTIGWIAHAIEQYGNEAIIRPRARYVGVQPGAARASA